MWRLAVVFTGVCAVLVTAGGPAGAVVGRAPSPSGAGNADAAPQTVCAINDSKIVELSGLVATDAGYVAINDSNSDASAIRIFKLDNRCKLVSSVAYPTNAADPEDLAVAPDGTIWVADIGDNDARRRTVGFWRLAPNAKSPVPIRVTYPDGARDAEAILLGADGVPIIFTKEPLKPVGIYVPSATLVPNSQNGVPLKRVGEWKIPSSSTPNQLGVAGRIVVTGGATSPDGRKVVLRTYADAYEWDVPDGDVVKAVTTTQPRVTPLPNEPQGEAITYTRDGKSFVTVSDLDGSRTTPLLRYTPTAPAVAAPAKKTAGADKDATSAASSLTLDDIMYLVAGVGLLGLLLVLAGVLGIRRSRRTRRAAAGGGPGTGRAVVGGQGRREPGRPTGRGPAGRGPDLREPDRRGADVRDPDRRGLDGRGLDGRGLDGRGPDVRGPDGRGPDGRGPAGSGGGPPGRGGYDDGFGLVDARPPSRRGGGPEPSTPSGGIRTGAVYGGRREPPAGPEWDEDDYRDDTRGGRSRR